MFELHLTDRVPQTFANSPCTPPKVTRGRQMSNFLENLHLGLLHFYVAFFSSWLILTLVSFILKASRCVGKNSRVLVCHCRRADDRAPGACHCFQLQLLLSQGDRPGRDAVAKFQPCPNVSIHAWSFRWETLKKCMGKKFYQGKNFPSGKTFSA